MSTQRSGLTGQPCSPGQSGPTHFLPSAEEGGGTPEPGRGLTQSTDSGWNIATRRVDRTHLQPGSPLLPAGSGERTCRSLSPRNSLAQNPGLVLEAQRMSDTQHSSRLCWVPVRPPGAVCWPSGCAGPTCGHASLPDRATPSCSWVCCFSEGL